MPVTTHKYRTPTKADPDAWSVGMMGLTEREANAVVEYARLIMDNRRRRAERPLDMGQRYVAERKAASEIEYAKAANRMRLTLDQAVDAAREAEYDRSDPVKWSAETAEDIVRDAARQPEPDEERNRFSGLDLD